MTWKANPIRVFLEACGERQVSVLQVRGVCSDSGKGAGVPEACEFEDGS